MPVLIQKLREGDNIDPAPEYVTEILEALYAFRSGERIARPDALTSRPSLTPVAAKSVALSTGQRTTPWSGRPLVSMSVRCLRADDGHFAGFREWVAPDRYPAEDGFRRPLTLDSILQIAITGTSRSTLTEEEDDLAVALLSISCASTRTATDVLAVLRCAPGFGPSELSACG